MHEIFAKYESLCKDGQWDTNPKKDVKIVALTSHILELKIPFTKKSASQENNKKLMVTQKDLTTVADHGKQSLQNMVNLGQKKNRRTWHW